MTDYIIEGGNRISGVYAVQGSKNSALPILVASVMTEGVSVIENCPLLTDVNEICRILSYLDCDVKHEGRTVTVDPRDAAGTILTNDMTRSTRASFLFAGALLAKSGRLTIAAPGGDSFSMFRPVDIHISALQKLGAKIEVHEGYYTFTAPDGLKGAPIALKKKSVGATENAILAACLADGETEITNAAEEPEIADLAAYLNRCGAKISGAGTSKISITGVKKLNPANYCVMPDRIAAVTYLTAAAVTKGEIDLVNVCPANLRAVLDFFTAMGCSVRTDNDAVHLTAPERLRRVENLIMEPYPRFPTDAQPFAVAALSLADGVSTVRDTVFPGRFVYVSELRKFGAKIDVPVMGVARIEGVEKLTGAEVYSADIRGAAALMLAGLAAEGETRFKNVCHLERGYESPEKVLNLLNAKIRRIEDDGK